MSHTAGAGPAGSDSLCPQNSWGLLHLLLLQLLPLPICGCIVAPQDPPQPAWFSSLQVLACEQEI